MPLPERPPLDPADPDSPKRWAEYLERYDRALANQERQLEQNADYNRLIAENNRLTAEAQAQSQEQHRQQVRQWEYGQKVGRYLLYGLGALCAAGLLFAAVKAVVTGN